MKMLHILLLLQLLFLSSSSHGAVQDFCVGNLKLPQTPEGYPCRNPAELTADDFVFTGFRKSSNTSNLNKANAILASADSFPGVNGLGLSVGRLDLDVGGVIPLHTHHGGSEMIVVIQGTIIAGFISNANVPYIKTLGKFDSMIFPRALLHFQINIGKKPALAFVSLNGATPGFQATELVLFANNLPTAIVEKNTFIEEAEVKRLKALFGGTN